MKIQNDVFLCKFRAPRSWPRGCFWRLPKIILDKNKKSPQTLFILPCPAVPPPKATHTEPHSVGCMSGVADWLPLGPHLYTATTGLRAVEDFVVVGLTDSLGVTTRLGFAPPPSIRGGFF